MGGIYLHRAILVLLVGVCITRTSRADDPAPMEPAVVQALQDATELLSDPSRDKRREAEGKLWQAGLAAEPILRAYIARAEAEGNTDGARRGELVLKYLPYGLTDPTADSLIPLIDQYLAATDLAEKRKTLQNLYRPTATCAVVMLLTSEEDIEQREELFRIANQYSNSRHSQQMIGEGRLDIADRWLALASTVPDQPGAEDSRSVSAELFQQDYAVFLQYTGNLDAKITALEASLLKPSDETRDAIKHRCLAHLYRIKGDLPAACGHARAAGLQGRHILKELLWQAADWTASLELESQLTAESKNSRELGSLLAFSHLAGDQNKFNEVAARHLLLVEQDPTGVVAGYPYILCDRPDLALEAYRKSFDTLDAFELLCAQYRYAEAFKLLDEVTAAGGKPMLDIQRSAGVEYRRLGLIARSDELFTQAGANALKLAESNPDDVPDVVRLLAMLAADELNWGLREQAFSHAAQAIDLPPSNGANDYFVIQKVFNQDQEVTLCWQVLRNKFSDEPKSESLRRLRAIREHTISIEDLRDLVKLVDNRRIKSYVLGAHLPEMLHARLVAELKGAEPTQEQKAELDALVQMLPPMRAGNDGARRAEFLVDTHDPASAIAEYGRQWERDKSQPLPLYLKGLALRSAGREEEAKQAIETAHLLPLGRIWERQQLWKDLLDRGFPDEAARQREVMMKVDRGSGPVDDAIRPTAIDAWKHGDPRKGADLFDQSLPGLSQGEFVLARLHFYLDVANDRHRMKADVLLSNGDVDGAMKELRTCQSLMPVSTMPIEVAAKLEAAGHRAEADELIAGTVAVQEANIGLYPDTPQFHNELAWLFSKTHRRLDDALAHSKKAVSLQPKFYDYYDTLADVHFHRDERQEAIETIQHALSLAREVHRDDLVAAGEKRLKHFEEDAIPTGAEKFD